MYDYESYFPPNVIVGTTVETNRSTKEISKAPHPYSRSTWLEEFGTQKMISIEPIMNFDLEPFVRQIRWVSPEFVSIGADSKNHNLPEPPAGKIKELIAELGKFTEVRIKPNLNRLLKKL